MEVVSPGVNGQIPSPDLVAINPEVIVQYLVDLLEITLGALKEDLERVGSLLSEARRHDTIQRCTKFASESQVALYVLKDVVLPDQLDDRQLVSS